MKKQAFNPYLPSWEYIPDGEPYVFGDRVYVYGSHDCFNGDKFCMNDYVCWSAPVTDLADWRYEGVIYKKTDDPMNPDGSRCLYAPDVQKGPDGRYYLYYAFDFLSVMSVAVCDTPAGEYKYYGSVHMPDGYIVGTKSGDVFQFDPGVFIDDDGRVFLYLGFAPRADLVERMSKLDRRLEGCYMYELERDMVTVKRGPELLLPGPTISDGTSFAEHAFFEAASMRKLGDKYYLIYSSTHSHELCYAVSDRPDGGFVFGGTIVSNADIFLDKNNPQESWNYPGNTHGSIIEIEGQWYVFYHRHTNRHPYSRQACAEAITILPDGSIPQVQMTSCGLNGGPLHGKGVYEARVACNLRSKDGTRFSYVDQEPDDLHPYFTQDGPDRESDGNQYIANFKDGALAGFKYFDFNEAKALSVKIRGNAVGSIVVSTKPNGTPVAEIKVAADNDWKEFGAPLNVESGTHALFFTFKGEGSFDFISFVLN